MKGILLAGGTGSRLLPATGVISKQLLPIYNKPMIYYPLTTLMMAGIRAIQIITTPQDAPLFRKLLGNGRQWGLDLSYAEQPSPTGIADALCIAAPFLAGDDCALVLGDNLLYGQGLADMLQNAAQQNDGATIFVSQVADPSAYGVIEFDSAGTPLSIVEKPDIPPSDWAVTGLYFYNREAVGIAENLSPSARGELEITDVNRAYLGAENLQIRKLGRGYAWLDTGTHASLIEAANFIRTLEQRQGLLIGSPEEVAFRNGWINATALARLADDLKPTGYGSYLDRLAREAI